MLAEPARGHRPAGIAQMMDHHEEQRAERDTQEKHERQQPRKTELRRVHRGANHRQHRADDHQYGGHLSPSGQVQRWQFSFLLRTHVFKVEQASRLSAKRVSTSILASLREAWAGGTPARLYGKSYSSFFQGGLLVRRQIVHRT